MPFVDSSSGHPLGCNPFCPTTVFAPCSIIMIMAMLLLLIMTMTTMKNMEPFWYPSSIRGVPICHVHNGRPSRDRPFPKSISRITIIPTSNHHSTIIFILPPNHRHHASPTNKNGLNCCRNANRIGIPIKKPWSSFAKSNANGVKNLMTWCRKPVLQAWSNHLTMNIRLGLIPVVLRITKRQWPNGDVSAERFPAMVAASWGEENADENHPNDPPAHRRKVAYEVCPKVAIRPRKAKHRRAANRPRYWVWYDEIDRRRERHHAVETIAPFCRPCPNDPDRRPDPYLPTTIRGLHEIGPRNEASCDPLAARPNKYYYYKGETITSRKSKL